MFDKHEANSHRQLLQRILNIGHFNPVFNNKTIVHTFFDEHGSLVQIFIFKTNRQRSVTLAILNIGLSYFLEQVEDGEEETFFAGVVERRSLEEIDHVEVDIGMGE